MAGGGDSPRKQRVHVLTVEEMPLEKQFKRFWDTEKFGTEEVESKRKVRSRMTEW